MMIDSKIVALVKQNKKSFLEYNGNFIFLAHKTSKKSGEFVCIWKKNNFNQNVPYEEKDDFIFMIIIFSDSKECLILHKNILKEKNIIHSSIGSGKRGMRVYSSFCKLDTDHARQTANWQKSYLKEIF